MLSPRMNRSMKSLAAPMCFIFSVVLQASAYGQAPNKPTGLQPNANQNPQRQERYQQFLQRFDTNKNGRIDPDELAKARQAIQQRQQQNRPGSNSTTQPQNNTARPNMNSQQYRQLLQRFDKDGDGRLSGDELQAARQARQQMQGSLRGRQLAGRILFNFGVRKNRLDSNKLMSEYDRNSDGELNAAERRSAIEALEKK